MQMPWGKYRGVDLKAVPDDYLLWALDNCDRLSPTLRRAIEVRLGLVTPAPPPANPARNEALAGAVARWYRAMAAKYHPDRGGSTEQMQAINDAYAELRRALGV